MLKDKLPDARILIVDDQPDTLKMLEVILGFAGYSHIECTTDPRQAASLYSQFQPDLVLLDLMMPELDGFQVMEHLKAVTAANSFVPIVILTADMAVASKQRALREGASDFLVRPFDTMEVLLRIGNLLHTRFLHLDLQRQNALQASLFEEVKTAHQDLQVLSQRLFDAQEVERRHIARELHDEIGTALTAIKINMQAAQHVAQHATDEPIITAAPAITNHLTEGIGIVEHLLCQVRELSLNLRPSMLDDFGLVETLAWCIDRQTRRAGLTGHFTHETFDGRLDPAIETACFRVVQEAVTNVVRHAKASKVNVEMRRHERELEIIIRDDGIGFEVNPARQRATRGGSLGVLGMQERVELMQGRFEIDSHPGAGTAIRARFPLNQEPPLTEN